MNWDEAKAILDTHSFKCYEDYGAWSGNAWDYQENNEYEKVIYKWENRCENCGAYLTQINEVYYYKNTSSNISEYQYIFNGHDIVSTDPVKCSTYKMKKALE